MSDFHALVPRLRPFARSIFAETAQLVATHGAVNLGQGMPDSDGPRAMVDAAARALQSGYNQYGPANGIPELREQVANYRRDLYATELDPETDVTITVGATEALCASVMGLLNPGDEVLIFDPWYELYPAAAAMAGAIPVPVPLSDGWRPDARRLEAAITGRTRMLILNTPHNPTGIVFTEDELTDIADVAIRHDMLILSDEVYEQHTLDRPHVPAATIPGLAERTVTASAVSKLFHATGWKLGWAMGPRHLIDAVTSAKQWMSFCPATPLQYGAAEALRTCRPWWAERAATLAQSRALLREGLESLGLTVEGGEGSFFLTTDISPISQLSAREWCQILPERAGVAAIPMAALCSDDSHAPTSVRWSFCVTPETITSACERLQATDLSFTSFT